MRGTHPPLAFTKTTQFKTWLVCQRCGRVGKPGDDDWINAPMLTRDGAVDPRGLNVVRCPIHWSEWALRISIGRTDANRAKMAELKVKYAHLKPPKLTDPFPVDETLPPMPDRKKF